MPVNKSIEPPTWFLPVLSDSASVVAPGFSECRGFDVWAAGVIKWTDQDGYTQSRTFAAPFPIRITGQIQRIWTSTTTVAASDIGALR